MVIIYNHRYDKNIGILERLYHGRFSHIYHLVPFYDGDKTNVIAVYENCERVVETVSNSVSANDSIEANLYNAYNSLLKTKMVSNNEMTTVEA